MPVRRQSPHGPVTRRDSEQFEIGLVTLATINLRVRLLNQSIEVTMDRVGRKRSDRGANRTVGRGRVDCGGFPMGALTTQRLKRFEEFLESDG